MLGNSFSSVSLTPVTVVSVLAFRGVSYCYSFFIM